MITYCAFLENEKCVTTCTLPNDIFSFFIESLKNQLTVTKNIKIFLIILILNNSIAKNIDLF